MDVRARGCSFSPEGDIIGQSAKLQHLIRQAELVGPTDSTVLLFGETGTGKSRFARLIHDSSSRRLNAFVKVNCSAIPVGLLESELFGHEKGAFTGAVSQRAGRFELADKGSLFLDEIGDIPLDLQPKLLRVLQEQEFERLGSAHTIRTDVRVIAATHRGLRQMVKDGQFRLDLFYRLNVFPITVPPLRERPEDVPLLVQHFVDIFAKRMGRHIERIPPDVMALLVTHSWPGNIRELENLIERSVILSLGSDLEIPEDELESCPPEIPEPVTMKDVQRAHIIRMLHEAKGVIGPAAARLGVPRSTLFYQMRRLGIRTLRHRHAVTGKLNVDP